MPNTFENIESAAKAKEEKEKAYQGKVQEQLTGTKMRHGQFERRRYTRKAELAQLIAVWREELKQDPEVLKEEEQNGTPVNIAIDCLAGEKLGECLKYVARGCRWIQIATLAGDICPIDFRNIFVKNIKIIGSTLRSKTPEEKGILLNELVEKTWSKFSSGDIKVQIHKTFPLCEADEAQQTLYRGENVGKVVLIVK